MILPKDAKNPPLNGAPRGLRGGHAPILCDAVHVVGDEGVCVAGIVCMTFDDKPMDPMITVMVPVPTAPPQCVGRVRHDDDQHQMPRTWHDPAKCKGERFGTPNALRLIS